jgi:predicted small lipoprotein YifL
MRFARFLIPALAVIAFVVLLAGCGGKGGGGY